MEGGGSGFSVRIQPKIPADLVNSLMHSETARLRFKVFMEQEINALIAKWHRDGGYSFLPFVTPTNEQDVYLPSFSFAHGARIHFGPAVTVMTTTETTRETSAVRSAFTSVAKKRSHAIDGSALALSTGLCQSTVSPESKAFLPSHSTSSPPFCSKQFLFCPRPSFPGFHPVSASLPSQPQHPARHSVIRIPHVHHYCSDQGPRPSNSMCQSGSSALSPTDPSMLPSPEMFASWSSDLALVLANGTVRAA